MILTHLAIASDSSLAPRFWRGLAMLIGVNLTENIGVLYVIC
ncbi:MULTISPECIES: hypothetical protein [Nostocales]|jgi:hypothetical protein|nr:MULTISPECIES: hypothetical protein [Nostocales]